MPLASVLVHIATPLREEPEEPEYVEGEPAKTEPVAGTPFDCLLIFPRGGEEDESPRGRRRVRRPVILYEGFDQKEEEFALHSEDRVGIVAEELTGSGEVLWQVEGEPTPLAKPGFLVGYEAALKRVED